MSSLPIASSGTFRNSASVILDLVLNSIATEFIQWFQVHTPAWQSSRAWHLLLALLFAALVLSLKRKWFWPLLAGAFVIARFPSLGGTAPNVDETWALAIAQKLALDPRPYVSIDPETSGVLNFAPLLALVPLHWAWSVAQGRLVAMAMQLATLFCLWKAAGCWMPSSRQRVVALLVTAMLALANEPSFVHYSSETVAVFLSAFLLWQWSRKSPPWVMALGIVLLPLAKVQAVPVAVAFLIMCWSKELLKPLILLASMIYGLALLWLRWQGVFDFFWHSAMLRTMARTARSHDAWWVILGEPLARLWDYPDTRFALLVLGCALALSLARGARPLQMPFVLVMVLGGLYAAGAPGTYFGHYLSFLFVPAAMVLILVVAAAKQDSRWLPWLAVGLCLLHATVREHDIFDRHHYWMDRDKLKVAFAMRQYKPEGTRVAMWGWNPELFLLARMPTATRFACFCPQVLETGELQRYFKDAYLLDVQKNQPEMFVDAVGTSQPLYQTPEYRHDRYFPELARYVSEHYQLREEVDGARIYVRK